MRRTSRRTADPRLVGALALVGLLTTGCVTMPAGGPPERVEMPQGAADNLQVHVYPVAPHPGESPADLLTGFLDSTNADQAGYDTAKQYLTAEAGKRWKPEAGVTVLATTTVGSAGTPKQDDTGAELTVHGELVATLDAQHSYQAGSGTDYQRGFGFVKETEGPNKGEWRIDRLPDGLILDQTNFKNGYTAVQRYFFARTDPSVEQSAPTSVLVPDPIYLRSRIDPLTAAAVANAAGPSDWLSGAVENPLGGVRVQSVAVGDNRVATVRVEGDLTVRPQQCTLMAEQLFHTVAGQQGKGQLDRLDLSGGKGGCSVGSGQAAQVAPGALAGGLAGTQAYFQLDDGRLMVFQEQGQGTPVPGVLGQVQPQHPGAVAVRRDGGAAAAVAQDGRALYLTGLGEAARLGEPVVTSRAPKPESGLASPSWDGRHDLWLVDRDPAAPRVLMVRGNRTVVPVRVEGLGAYSVQALRISSDGVRVALVLHGANGGQRVALGLVTHTGTRDAPQATITGVRVIASQLTDVASVSWADTDQLVVLGKETNKLQQLHYLGTDGSQSTDSVLQGGELTAVSTTEARSAGDQGAPPVLAVSDHRIWRLKDNQWREVPTKQQQAVAFNYPG